MIQSRDAEGFSLGGVLNNENPTTVPLGSGLLIMVAAGAGYAVARRKNAARKGMTLLLACALMLGLTQCKKNTVTPITPSTTENRINITLNANTGGEKTTFDPANGTFNWLQGYGADAVEYINVGGSQSGYLGQLNNNDNKGTGKFKGSITTPQNGETLYFFYLGNGNHEGASTVDFSSQDGTLANVTNCHIAIGSEEYTGQTNFSATLNMAMAIAYFDLSQFTSDSKAAETVYLNGNHIYSTASVNYNDGTITGNSKGYIKVGTANNGMYVALIPSVTTSTTLNFNSSSKTGSMTFNNGIKPAYFYSNSGGALLVEAIAESGIPCTFSVSATKKVFFSKGNLQYQASTNTWRFAENQYDAIGNNAGNNNFEDSRSTQSDWIDLFGWGTSGWDGASAYSTSHYQPWAYLGNNPSSTYGYGYGPSTKEGNSYNYTYSLTGTYANCDWGVYNTISDGGTGWRTLTGGDDDFSEWKYLLQTRNASTVAGTANARFFKAKVNDIQGIVILPDVYTHPDGINNPAYINQTSYLAWSNVSSYNQAQWEAMEAAGAVFLPMGGYRSYSSNNPGYTSGYAYYWSTTVKSNSDAYNMQFSTGLSQNNVAKRIGCSVRLVKDVE